MTKEYKPLELQRVAGPINKIDIEKAKTEMLPYCRRKSDQKIFSNSIKTEDILTKEEIEKLKEDLRRKEMVTKMKLEWLQKEFNAYQIESEVELLFKDKRIKELEEKITLLEEEIANKEQTIILQKEINNKQKRIIMEQTTEYMDKIKHVTKENTKLNQEYSKAIARTVHDMKNPLTGIKSGIEVLLEDQTLSQDKIELLSLIYRSTNELTRMIEEILLNNKIIHNAVQLNKEEYDVLLQIKEIVSINKLTAKCSSKQFNFIYNGDNFIITADKNKIWRAIENIILNGLKYCKSKISVELNSIGEYIQIVVNDDGIGFDEDVKKKILSNRDMSTTDLINGNGFGLTNAKRIIEMHNGSISIKNENGNGSTVVIRLPKKYSS